MNTRQYVVRDGRLKSKWTAWIWYNGEQDSSREFPKSVQWIFVTVRLKSFGVNQ